MDIKIRVKDSRKLQNDIIKELLPKSSKITVGVKERPHNEPFRIGKSEHSKGGALTRLSTTQLAEIHEYGLGNVPRRSFIRDTIKRWLFKDVGSLAMKNYKRIDFFLKAISNKVYDRIQEAFDTNGWGQWKDLSDEYIRRTGRSLPALTDTGQLRAAIYTEYAGETKTGKKISGGHSAQRSDTGKYKPYGKMWLESLYNRGRSSITSFFHKG